MILMAIDLGIFALVIDQKDPLEKYGKYEDNVARLQNLVELDPSTYKLLDLNILQSGVRSSHKRLDAIEIVPNYVIGGNNPFIFVVCGMRANDFEAVKTCMELAESDLPAKFPNMNFIIAPISNPEGYDFAISEDPNWTKNREEHSNGCIGTKISRNFVHNFEQTDSPCGEDYSGHESLSAWEAKAIYERA